MYIGAKLMKLEEVIKTNRNQILQIAVKHGAVNVRVFGSVASRKSKEGSDLDLLVDISGKCTPFFPGGLITELEELLDVKVDVVTPKALHWYIRDKILKESKPL